KQATHMNFGLQEFSQEYSDEQTVTLRNTGNVPAEFDVSVVNLQGSPHKVEWDRDRIKVGAKSAEQLHFALTVPGATAGNSDDFRDVAGLIRFTPRSVSDNAGIA